MLPQPYRLRREQDFARLARTGRLFSGPALSIKCAPNRQAFTRCGIVVGKAVHQRANKRNLLRRRLRETIRPLLPALRPGFDLMLLTRPAALPLKPQQLLEILAPLLRRAGLLR